MAKGEKSKSSKSLIQKYQRNIDESQNSKIESIEKSTVVTDDLQVQQARQVYNRLRFSLKNTNESFSLDKDKIYTCDFKRAMKIFPDWRLVSVARWSPYNFNGSQFKSLAPPEDLHKAYKYKGLTEEDFIDIYIDRVLSQLDPKEVYEALKGKVICCWEPLGQFCHRHLILEWLKLELGSSIAGGEV